MIDNTHRLDTEDHFRTDVSYLPDLTAYLDDLLRTRERLAAASGADEWARAAAAPSEQEIARIRQLINRIKGDIAGLTPHERARIDQAVAVVRKHRAVTLGMPRLRQDRNADARERHRRLGRTVGRCLCSAGSAAAGEPWQYYDLGHGLCSYTFFVQWCPHRMACAKCGKGNACLTYSVFVTDQTTSRRWNGNSPRPLG